MANKLWEIWLVEFAYEDDPGKTKLRPALIVHEEGSEYYAAKITSYEPRDSFPKDYPISKWKKAGLKHSSTVRLSQINKFKQTDLIRYIGSVDPVDIFYIQIIMSKT